jgi:hypothetical protein
VAAALALLALGAAAQADVFNRGGTQDAYGNWTGVASLEITGVGNLGNSGWQCGCSGGGSGSDRVFAATLIEFVLATVVSTPDRLARQQWCSAVDSPLPLA